MIVLFTDFGLDGPYIGQLHAAIARHAPAVPVINLFADVPAFRTDFAAHLLAAYGRGYPAGTVFLCVVDPGVGTDERRPAAVLIDGCWYVGPDNGMFDVIASRAESHVFHDINWLPETLSDSFHGRDLFAPVAAWLATGERPDFLVASTQGKQLDLAPSLTEVIYIDHFGNAMTGIRGDELDESVQLELNGRHFYYARTFGEVGVGEGFWYRNANDLVEVSVNQGHAETKFGLRLGMSVRIINTPDRN